VRQRRGENNARFQGRMVNDDSETGEKRETKGRGRRPLKFRCLLEHLSRMG
jgi:hypothetical protein